MLDLPNQLDFSRFRRRRVGQLMAPRDPAQHQPALPEGEGNIGSPSGSKTGWEITDEGHAVDVAPEFRGTVRNRGKAADDGDTIPLNRVRRIRAAASSSAVSPMRRDCASHIVSPVRTP